MEIMALEPRPTRVAGTGTTVAYALGDVAGTALYQAFTFMVFTFYYAIVGINVNLMMWGYILWALWNAANDPIAGYLSDRTRTRWGRRLPWIWSSIVPLCIVMYLLFTPPLTSELLGFAYFMVVVFLFDALYTIFALNHTAIFPEMFITEEERAKASRVRSILTIVGLIIAFIGTTFLISDVTSDLVGYRNAGALVAILALIFAAICIKWGLYEKAEFRHDVEETPPAFEALKHTLRNRAFWPYLGAAFCSWFVFGIIPTVMPLYCAHVLGVSEGILVGLLLLTGFLVAAVSTFLWKVVGRRIGIRNAYALSMAVWIVTLMPFFIISDLFQGFIAMFFMGIGLAGPIFFLNIVIAQVIDDDEIRTGVRREGAYFGTNALFIRLPIILEFLCIGLVFSGTGWSSYTPIIPGPYTIFGLRMLMAGFPSIALALAILCLWRYPLHGARLAENERILAQLHAKKIERALKERGRREETGIQ